MSVYIGRLKNVIKSGYWKGYQVEEEERKTREWSPGGMKMRMKWTWEGFGKQKLVARNGGRRRQTRHMTMCVCFVMTVISESELLSSNHTHLSSIPWIQQKYTQLFTTAISETCRLIHQCLIHSYPLPYFDLLLVQNTCKSCGDRNNPCFTPFVTSAVLTNPSFSPILTDCSL